MTLYFGFVLADAAVDRKVAWVSFGPVKVENTQERGVNRICQPVVSRATTEVALTQRNLVIVRLVCVLSNVMSHIHLCNNSDGCSYDRCDD